MDEECDEEWLATELKIVSVACSVKSKEDAIQRTAHRLRTRRRRDASGRRSSASSTVSLPRGFGARGVHMAFMFSLERVVPNL